MVDLNVIEQLVTEDTIKRPNADMEDNDLPVQNSMQEDVRRLLRERFEGKLPTYKGTYFYGGAGFNGSYISDMLLALREAGISNVYSGHNGSSTGQRNYSSAEPQSLMDAASVVFINQSGTYRLLGTEEFKAAGPQFNLIGYSYGAIIAAIKAVSYAKLYNGTLDHLVLVGAPIEKDLLDEAKSTGGIKKVIVVDLKKHVPNNNDPIFAGMSDWQIMSSMPELNSQQGADTGHFWYAPATPEGARRRRELAKYLYDQGLR